MIMLSELHRNVFRILLAPEEECVAWSLLNRRRRAERGCEWRSSALLLLKQPYTCPTPEGELADESHKLPVDRIRAS